MKLFKRIFIFSAMMLLGVLSLASCSFAGGTKKIEIDMSTRVYVSDSYDLVAKNENDEILTDVEWTVTKGNEFAVIKDGKLVILKAGVFSLRAKSGKYSTVKQFSAVNPFEWKIEYNLNGGDESEDLFTSYNEFDEGKERCLFVCCN